MSEKERQPEQPDVKLTVVIPGEIYSQLYLMSLRTGQTRTDALKQMIADRFFLEEKINEGSEVLLRSPQGETFKVNFRNSGNPELPSDDRIE